MLNSVSTEALYKSKNTMLIVLEDFVVFRNSATTNYTKYNVVQRVLFVLFDFSENQTEIQL